MARFLLFISTGTMPASILLLAGRAADGALGSRVAWYAGGTMGAIWSACGPMEGTPAKKMTSLSLYIWRNYILLYQNYVTYGLCWTCAPLCGRMEL